MTDQPTSEKPKKGTTRRRLLWGGGTLLLVASGGVVWRGIDRGAFTTAQGPAYAPWDLWNDPDLQDTPLALVAAAVLAANAHNTQPWLFEVSDTEIAIHADLSRNLGAFDPYLREMHLSLGCALENIRVAAPAHGFATAILPEGGSLETVSARQGRRLAARIRLSRNGTHTDDALLAALPDRHTDRGAYDREKPVPLDLRTRLDSLADAFPDCRMYLFTDGPVRERFDRLTVEATERIIADTRMVRDSDRWFRLTKDEVEEHRDGPTIDAAGLPPAIRIMAKLLPPLSSEQTHAAWLQSTRDIHLPSASVTGYIAVRDLYDLRQTLDAGMLWQRLHLTGIAEGLALHPVNQTVEVVDREKELGSPARMAEALGDLIGTRSWRPTFAFRAGYPKSQALPSPRRTLRDVVL